MPAPPRLSAAPWLLTASARAVFGCLARGGYEARAVGGAVRNGLLGLPVADVDLATTAPPDEVIRLARAAGLAVIPTGLDHGTVTVVAGGTAYEVTTLRRDIQTFGRHAHVDFTTDWTEDAQRRDFTINALYCAADGTVHDPLGGWPDLVARRVRFIGDAGARIREDYLRILRFFRFTAEYVEGAPDPAGLAACRDGIAGLDALSGERLRAEMLKLLVAPGAVAVIEIMAQSGILEHVIGHPGDIAALRRLAALERVLSRAPDATLRLACLAVTAPEQARHLHGRLRLSNDEAAMAQAAARPDPACDAATPEADAKLFIYRHGADAFAAATLLAWARSGAAADDDRWRTRFTLPERFPRPVLPVRGSDLLALGIAPGPEVGRLLGVFEAWWIAAGFPADSDGNSRRLRDLAAGREIHG